MTFDPNTFLGATYTSATSTEYAVVPEGDYEATIVSLEPRSVETKDGERIILDVVWQIRGDEEFDGRRVRQTVWLDLTPEGHLDMSEHRNVPLGRLRQALGQNVEGRPWSLNDLLGSKGHIRVAHTMRDERIYPKVTRVGSEGEEWID